MGIERFPICPACNEPVRTGEHELRLQLVNAAPGSPKENTDITDIFHHACAADVWKAATEVWRGGRVVTAAA